MVRPRPGDANISRSVVRFPTSAFIAQEHIRTVCTRVQFAADACPKGSIYGRAIAHSPLLDQPLKGNVYLRSSNSTLPDAVADLRGPAHQPIRVEVAVRNDSVKGALRNTVLAAPDAPVTFFRLQMFGGNKGLIVNSRNICKGKNQARVTMRAHNGRRDVRRVNVFNKRCKQQRKAQRRKAAKRKRAQGRRGLVKQASVHPDRPSVHHFRTADGLEVDAVIERRGGPVCAIEVKAAASLTSRDSRGLRALADSLGEEFGAGVLLHTGREAVMLGPKIWALPLAALWA